MRTKKTASKRGKPTNLYLRDDDIAKVRELVAFVAGEGERVSESLIVRAAIGVAKADRTFLAAFRDAASRDLRFKS